MPLLPQLSLVCFARCLDRLRQAKIRRIDDADAATPVARWIAIERRSQPFDMPARDPDLIASLVGTIGTIGTWVG